MRRVKIICYIFIFSLILIKPNYIYSDSRRDYLSKEEKKAYDYFHSLSLEEFIDVIRQGAIDAIEKGGTWVEEFPLGIGYILGYHFDGPEELYTDKVRLAFIKVIQDKNETWLLRYVLINWSYPLTTEEDIKASSISSDTWLKLISVAKNIIQDKGDDPKIREAAVDLIQNLYPEEDRTYINESLLQTTWQGIFKIAKDVTQDNEDSLKVKRKVHSLFSGIICYDYKRLKGNKSLLLFPNKDILLSQLEEDVNSRISLLKNQETPLDIRYAAMGGLTKYYKIDIPQSAQIKRTVLDVFYREKEIEDKKFCLWLARSLILRYQVYSIKPDLQNMLEQDIDRETKNKIRQLLKDLDIMERKYGS